jgi:hypothetical protein
MRSYQYPYMSNFDDYQYPYLAYATSVKKCPSGQRCINYDRNGCKQCSGSGGSSAPGPIDKLLNVGGSGGGATVDPNKSVHEAFWDQFTGGAKGSSILKGGGSLAGGIGAVLQGKPINAMSDKEINESVGNRPDFLSTLGGDNKGGNPFDFANIDWNEMTKNPAMYVPLMIGIAGLFAVIMIIK